MKNDFGLGGRAWRGESAAGMIGAPASGEERMRFCWSVLCWLSWRGQVFASSAISSRARFFLFHNGDEPL